MPVHQKANSEKGTIPEYITPKVKTTASFIMPQYETNFWNKKNVFRLWANTTYMKLTTLISEILTV